MYKKDNWIQRQYNIESDFKIDKDLINLMKSEQIVKQYLVGLSSS